jgi:hypothetical protein
MDSATKRRFLGDVREEDGDADVVFANTQFGEELFNNDSPPSSLGVEFNDNALSPLENSQQQQQLPDYPAEQEIAPSQQMSFGGGGGDGDDNDSIPASSVDLRLVADFMSQELNLDATNNNIVLDGRTDKGETKSYTRRWGRRLSPNNADLSLPSPLRLDDDDDDNDDDAPPPTRRQQQQQQQEPIRVAGTDAGAAEDDDNGDGDGDDDDDNGDDGTDTLREAMYLPEALDRLSNIIRPRRSGARRALSLIQDARGDATSLNAKRLFTPATLGPARIRNSTLPLSVAHANALTAEWKTKLFRTLYLTPESLAISDAGSWLASRNPRHPYTRVYCRDIAQRILSLLVTRDAMKEYADLTAKTATPTPTTKYPILPNDRSMSGVLDTFAVARPSAVEALERWAPIDLQTACFRCVVCPADSGMFDPRNPSAFANTFLGPLLENFDMTSGAPARQRKILGSLHAARHIFLIERPRPPIPNNDGARIQGLQWTLLIRDAIPTDEAGGRWVKAVDDEFQRQSTRDTFRIMRPSSDDDNNAENRLVTDARWYVIDPPSEAALAFPGEEGEYRDDILNRRVYSENFGDGSRFVDILDAQVTHAEACLRRIVEADPRTRGTLADRASTASGRAHATRGREQFTSLRRVRILPQTPMGGTIPGLDYEAAGTSAPGSPANVLYRAHNDGESIDFRRMVLGALVRVLQEWEATPSYSIETIFALDRRIYEYGTKIGPEVATYPYPYAVNGRILAAIRMNTDKEDSYTVSSLHPDINTPALSRHLRYRRPYAAEPSPLPPPPDVRRVTMSIQAGTDIIVTNGQRGPFTLETLLPISREVGISNAFGALASGAAVFDSIPQAIADPKYDAATINLYNILYNRRTREIYNIPTWFLREVRQPDGVIALPVQFASSVPSSLGNNNNNNNGGGDKNSRRQLFADQDENDDNDNDSDNNNQSLPTQSWHEPSSSSSPSSSFSLSPSPALRNTRTPATTTKRRKATNPQPTLGGAFSDDDLYDL